MRRDMLAESQNDERKKYPGDNFLDDLDRRMTGHVLGSTPGVEQAAYLAHVIAGALVAEADAPQRLVGPTLGRPVEQPLKLGLGHRPAPFSQISEPSALRTVRSTCRSLRIKEEPRQTPLFYLCSGRCPVTVASS